MSKLTKLFLKEQSILKQLGEDLKLARLRRKYSSKLVAERTNISRTILWNVEKGNSISCIPRLLQVLSVCGLEKDLLYLAEDDILGRKTQDPKLTVSKKVPKNRGDEKDLSFKNKT